PPAAVLAANQLLTARARELREAGLDGGTDELRVLAYLERLGVLDPLASGADPAAGPGGDPHSGPGGPDSGPRGQDGEPGGDPDGGGDGPGSGPDGGGSGPAAGGGLAHQIPPGGLAAHVNLTVPLATALHLADRPGLLSRTGPIDPAL